MKLLVERLHTSQLAIFGLAVPLSLVVQRRWWREAWQPAPPQLRHAGPALLVLGLGAIVATRAVRWDAAHPMPPDDPNLDNVPVRAELETSLPLAASDCLAINGPFLEPARDEVRVDGTRITRLEEVAEIFANKAELWRQLNPGEAFSGTLAVLAPSQARTDELLPWLSAASRGGYRRLAVYLRAPVVVLHTKTLGTLRKQRYCARTIDLSGSIACPLSSFPTWGDLARATHGTALSVSLQ